MSVRIFVCSPGSVTDIANDAPTSPLSTMKDVGHFVNKSIGADFRNFFPHFLSNIIKYWLKNSKKSENAAFKSETGFQSRKISTGSIDSNYILSHAHNVLHSDIALHSVLPEVFFVSLFTGFSYCDRPYCTLLDFQKRS